MLHRDLPSSEGHPHEWSPGALLALLVVVAVGLALGWASRGAAMPVHGDAALYESLARSLATGHYRDDYFVGAPPHAKYPPGMPAWLLLVRTLAGGSLDAALGANLLLLALTGLLLADAMRRLSTPRLGVVAAAVVMWSPALLALTALLRSEILFLACCAVALWVSLVDGQQARRWFPALAIGAALAAFLTRSVGIALLPAVGWALLLRRRWRPLIAGGAVALAVVGGWFAYTRWAGQHSLGNTYAMDLAVGPSVSAPLRFLSHALGNAMAYFAQFAAVQFSIPDINHQPLDNGVLGLLLAIPALVGSWMVARRWPALVMFLLLTIGILLVFPWTEGRFLTVLLPWLVATILIGWTGIMTAAGSRHSERIAIGVGLALAGFGLVVQLRVAQREQRCRASAPFVDPRCYKAEDRSYVAAAKFIRDSLPGDAVIAASRPAIIYLMAQRRTLPLAYFARTRASQFLTPDGHAPVILLSGLFPFEAAVVAPRLLERCSSWVLLAQYPSRTLLLGARPPATNTHPDACAALGQYLRDTPTDPDGDTH